MTDSILHILPQSFDLLLKQILDQQTTVPELKEALYYSVLQGGKRFRPVLVQASSSLYDMPFETIQDIAASVELIHAYSLVHDDLPAMDHSPLRRGQPSCWSKFEESGAILVGDALLTLAFETLAASQLSEAIIVQLMKELSKAIGARGMVAGQWLDIKQSHGHTLDDVHHLQNLKTGALIAFCCQSGAIVAARPQHEQQRLQQIGLDLGFLFQITDDLFDFNDNPQHIGKPTHMDSNKATFISYMGERQTKGFIHDLENKIITDLSYFGTKAHRLKEIVHFTKNRQY